MKHLIKIVLVIGGLVALFSAAAFFKKAPHEGEIRIGILQFASHPALDAARDGFKNVLTESFGRNVTFVEKNAQGSVSQAHLIAQGFNADKTLNGILAIATPAGQAAAAIEKERPLFVTAVTDPVAAGLTKDANVCGSTDMIDVAQGVTLLKALVPHVKTVAILFNQSEINATIVGAKLEELLNKADVAVVKIAVAQESDLIVAVEQAARSADAIMTPIDNSVANAISIVAKKALEAKKPLIVSDPMLVSQGALAGAGVSYTQTGEEAGRVAVRVLMHNEKPKDIGFVATPTNKIAINKDTLEKLDLTIPANLAATAEIVTNNH